MLLTLSGRSLRPSVVAGLAAGLAITWGLSGLYEVGEDQSGMVTRFGAFAGETGPGLHYHLPAPIEAVRQVPAGINRLDIAADDGDHGDAEAMLTRDGQLAQVSFSIQWRILDPYKYLFQFADPLSVLRHDATAAMRQAAAQTSFIDMTTASRGGAPARAEALLQAALQKDDLGVSAAALQIRDVTPPTAAQAGFHDMAAAREDAQIAARDVGAYRDRVLGAARADAAKAVQASQGYRDQEVSGAHGEAERFALVDAQYRKAPDVTRERLYTEMMERVLHNTNKVIVQTPKGFAGQIVLPPELFRTKPSGTPAQSQPVQSPPAQTPAQAQPQGQAGPSSASADAQSGPTA